jgi:L,D-transpeptidase-like protein
MKPGISRGRRFNRRAFVGASLGLTAASGFGPGLGFSPPGASAQQDAAAPQTPLGLGETTLTVYVSETGHTVTGLFLDYWRATGASQVFGNPLSEPFETDDGLSSQVFERGVLQIRPDLFWSVDPYVRLLPAARTLLANDAGAILPNGRRAGGGGNRQAAIWGPLDPKSVDPLDDSRLYVKETGHAISGDFLRWYRAHEGDFYLGNPLSEPFPEGNDLVQWFECGKLVENDEGVALAPLGKQLAQRLDVPTARVPQNELPEFEETLFWKDPSPFPLTDPKAVGPKRILVDVTNQAMQAFQGDSIAMETLVSTGIPPNKTEIGRFRVRIKYPVQDMRGFTNSTGEVVAAGDGSAPSGGIPYDVPAVPNVMYVNLDAEALHGAYWHHNFGHIMSHGCINLPLDVAAFLYGWAPLGTPVTTFLQPGSSYPTS